MTSEQQRAWDDLQYPALRAFCRKKLKPRGWKLNREQPAYMDCDNMIIPLLDKRGKKHWLQASPKGEITFRPVCFTIGAQEE